MAKKPQSLADIPAFPADAAQRLRSELSVSTAEQFLDLSSRYGESVQKVLGVDESTLAELQRTVTAAVPKKVAREATKKPRASKYPFRTGQDAPPPGEETF